jgi:hypothetical protein
MLRYPPCACRAPAPRARHALREIPQILAELLQGEGQTVDLGDRLAALFAQRPGLAHGGDCHAQSGQGCIHRGEGRWRLADGETFGRLGQKLHDGLPQPLHRLGQMLASLRRHCRHPGASHGGQIMVQPPQIAQDGFGVGCVAEAIGPLMLSLSRQGLDPRHGAAQPAVDLQECRAVERHREIAQDDLDQLREAPQHDGRRFRQEPGGAAGQDEERDGEPDDAAEPDLQHPVDGIAHGVGLQAAGAQQQDDGGDRGDAEAGPQRRDEGQRPQRHHESQAESRNPMMGNCQRYCHAPDGTGEGADQPVDAGLERSPDAPLHDDDGGEHRPIALGELQHLCQRESSEPGKCGAQGETQLAPAPLHESAKRLYLHPAGPPPHQSKATFISPSPGNSTVT